MCGDRASRETFAGRRRSASVSVQRPTAAPISGTVPSLQEDLGDRTTGDAGLEGDRWPVARAVDCVAVPFVGDGAERVQVPPDEHGHGERAVKGKMYFGPPVTCGQALDVLGDGLAETARFLWIDPTGTRNGDDLYVGKALCGFAHEALERGEVWVRCERHEDRDSVRSVARLDLGGERLDVEFGDARVVARWCGLPAVVLHIEDRDVADLGFGQRCPECESDREVCAAGEVGRASCRERVCEYLEVLGGG